jgi:DtxR family Mn-dependent transcriptional regulator
VPSLLIFAALVLLLAAAFWPRVGILARISRLRLLSERVQVEDALKHFYDCETRGIPGTLEGLAGVLEMSRGRALKILERAEAMDLVVAAPGGFTLSQTGRAYALRVLRTHRLLERFLADRTGTRPAEWHLQAERREHQLSQDETERLARRMGHPLYDPHGDPIPTASGELPAARGTPLSYVTPGSTVRITHLEDEPVEAFQRLLDQGFTLDMVLRVVEVTRELIRYEVDGREKTLARALAGNITVEPIADPGVLDPGVITLDQLAVGESGAVVGISPACRGPQRRRLLDLGVVPGTDIRAVMKSAAGDPIAYDIRGALIALRQEQAEWIRVRRATKEAAA